tara:strand:+ start:385 stop:1056 length:672 start_codon:yes stop_codon:yes gene_type:complete
MRSKSLTIVFLFISTLTFILGCWQLYRLEWKNNLIENINSSIQNPEFYNIKFDEYNELTSVKLDNNFKISDNPIFIESKTFQSKVGFHAITPLYLNEKIYSVLNLGWLPDKNIKNVIELVSLFNEKNGVDVYIRYLNSNKSAFIPENNIKDNTWFSVNKKDIETYYQEKIDSNYYFVLLDSDIKSEINPLVYLRNNHLNYSITWFLLSISSIVMLLIIRKKNG